MTTERAAAPRARAAGESNLGLYVITLLSAAYLGAWWAFGPRPGGPAQAPPLAPAPTPDPRVATWVGDLPPQLRPQVRLPVGWRLAETSTPTRAAPPVPLPVRVVPARRGRIRTRSS